MGAQRIDLAALLAMGAIYPWIISFSYEIRKTKERYAQGEPS